MIYDFQNKVYTTFADGKLIQDMNLNSSYILGRMYFDAFGITCPIGSSSNKQKSKILGAYISFLTDIKVASKR